MPRVQKSSASADLRLSKKDLKRPFCPHCYNGEIVYMEVHDVFMCLSCRETAFLGTKNNIPVKVIHTF